MQHLRLLFSNPWTTVILRVVSVVFSALAMLAGAF